MNRNEKRIEELKDRLKDAATLLLVQGRFFHGAPNHSGGFGDCPVPVCKYAREFSPAADLDLVEVFAEKEKCWLDIITQLQAKNAAIEEALKELVKTIDDLMDESDGVYGLHLNDDLAPWDSLMAGGQFEEWLLPLEAARDALPSEGDDGKN